MVKTQLFAAGLAGLALAACSSAPFGYAEDRCTGRHNQCQTACTGLQDGPARAACIERCYDEENRCRASGYDGTGSSLATDQGVGAARSLTEKEAGYEAWRLQKKREENARGENDVEIEVIEPKQQ